MRLRASGDKRELRQSYLPTLFSSLVQPLQDRGTDAVDDVIRRLDDYFLGKEEWDAIVEMGVGEGRGMEQVLKNIPSQTKAAFTRRCVARLVCQSLRSLALGASIPADHLTRCRRAQLQRRGPPDRVLQARARARKGQEARAGGRRARPRGSFRASLVSGVAAVPLRRWLMLTLLLDLAQVDEDLAEADADDDDGANSDASSDPGKDRMIKAKKPKGAAAAKKSASTAGTKAKAKK